jgi:hypothetical protein
MSNPNAGNGTPPFPWQRPEITITPSDEPLFEVDWRELAWWFGIPEAGDHTLWAMYDPPEWRLAYYYDLKALRPAVIHGIEGVEIASLEHEMGDKEQLTPATLFARLTESRVQCLATMFLHDNRRRLYTLLDEGFDEDWGESQRRVRQTGRLVQQPDRSYRQRPEQLRPGEDVEAMGVCHVTIGPSSFTCLRVLDVAPVFTEESTLMEGYLIREGRTVLCRRYNGRQWSRKPGSAHADKPPWDERFPTHNRIVIDGVTFVHWYDCLTDRACGVDASSVKPQALLE